MNKSFDDLIYQSGLIADGCWDQLGTYEQEAIERLIELTVRECIGVVEGGRFLHDQAPTALFAKECSSAIKRHFGVAEREL